MKRRYLADGAITCATPVMAAVELGARRLVVLPTGHACMQVRELTLDHLVEIRRKIADLKRLKRGMEEMAAQCSGERTPQCAIIDALFDTRHPSDEHRGRQPPSKSARAAKSALPI